MHVKPLYAITVAAMLVLGLTGASTAPASIPQGPTTQEVIAAFQVMHDSRQDRTTTCSGPDGEYREIRANSAGTLVSSDDRFSGAVTTDEWVLLNVTALKGTVELKIELRDPSTGALKFSGRAYGLLEGLALKGILVGALADGTRFTGNFSVVHDPPVGNPHNVTGEIGGPTAVPLDMAILQRGSCSGVVGA